MHQLMGINMISSYYTLGCVVTVVLCAVPHWQRQIPYNDIAHLYHSMYRELFIPFKETNQTAGNVILEKMEKVMEGVRELHHLTDVTPEQEFHKKYLMPVRFMILRGKKQWNMITYRDQELVDKYGWNESQLARFREIYREVMDLVNEMEEFCAVRHIDLSDDR